MALPTQSLTGDFDLADTEVLNWDAPTLPATGPRAPVTKSVAPVTRPVELSTPIAERIPRAHREELHLLTKVKRRRLPILKGVLAIVALVSFAAIGYAATTAAISTDAPSTEAIADP